MYVWLDEILARWRRQGRRPATTLGGELLSLEPGPLRNLIVSELAISLNHERASISRETVVWMVGAAIYSCGVLTISGMPILTAILWVGPTLILLTALFAMLSAALHSILRIDSARLNTVLAVMPQINRPAYVNALVPMLRYHPRNGSLWPTSANNKIVENQLILLMEKIEPAHITHWDGRDWVNFRSLLDRPHGSEKLAMTALSACGRIGGDQIVATVRRLATSPAGAAGILQVRDRESRQICASAQTVLKRIEARLADGREAAVLLRPSHVKDVVSASDLVRPVDLHERTPVSQLLRTPAEKSCDGSELLRVHNGE